MTTRNSRSYLYCLDKLVDEYDNTYHRSFGKKHIDANYFAWPKKLRRILNKLNSKLVIESGLQSTKIFLAKGTPKIGQEKYLWLILR